MNTFIGDDSDMDDPLISAIQDARADGRRLAPVGRTTEPRLITVNGRTYAGVAAIPWEALIAVNRADLLAQGFSPTSAGALMAHRSRRIKKAATDGTFSPAQIAALKAAGILS